jgi:anti-sigma factor RsiW
MRHVSPEDRVRLASGELSDERRREIEAHLDGCAECRRSQAELAAVRDLLGEWKVDAGPRDMWPAIERRLEDRARVTLRPHWRAAGWLLRIAAAIVLGVGLGHLAGRATLPGGAPRQLASAEEAERQASEGLGLHAIEWPSAAGLFPTVLDLMDAPQGGESRP